jgi:hypothetical protein
MSDLELRELERAARTGGHVERERYEAARDRVDPSWRFDKRVRELVDEVNRRPPTLFRVERPLSLQEVAVVILGAHVGEPNALLRRIGRDKYRDQSGLVVAVRESSLQPRLAVGIARRRDPHDLGAPPIDDCIRFKWPSLRPAMNVEVLQKVRVWAGDAWVSRVGQRSNALKSTACAPEAVADAWAARVLAEGTR